MCHFSSVVSTQEIIGQREQYRGLGHAIDRSIHTNQSRFSLYPLLHHNHPHVFEFRSHNMIVLSRKNISPSLTALNPQKHAFREFLRAKEERMTASPLSAGPSLDWRAYFLLYPNCTVLYQSTIPIFRVTVAHCGGFLNQSDVPLSAEEPWYCKGPKKAKI